MLQLISSRTRQLREPCGAIGGDSWGAVGFRKKEFVCFYPQVKPCLEDKFLFLMLTGETQVRAEPFQQKTALKQ